MIKEGIKAGSDCHITRPEPHAGALALSDSRESRFQTIDRIASSIGLKVLRLYAVPPVRSSVFNDCSRLALVAIDDIEPDQSPPWDNIAHLKALGFDVIAYGDGIHELPVRSKCVPLLAGAINLLDSSSENFEAALREIFQRTFASLEHEKEVSEQVFSLMHEYGIVGDSLAITSSFKSAMRFSELSDVPVLITGESGTGKELFAKAISKMDPKRKDAPFVVINCAAVSPGLMESEFFGHRRGAFTGADRERKGLIRAAQGGVVFLDEIGELDLGLQGKLLRVVQEKRLLGLGDEQEVAFDVRFIAATNRKLEDLVAERRFRLDLFHRLRVLHIDVPPLRERIGDLPLLIEYFLRRHHSLQLVPTRGVSEDFLEGVRQLGLPGNVRQLENLVRESLLNHQTGGRLDLNDLPLDSLRQLTCSSQSGGLGSCPKVWSESNSRGAPTPSPSELVEQLADDHGWNLDKILRECERQVMRAMLDRTEGNQTQAARLLGITTRSVYNKLRKHHLTT